MISTAHLSNSVCDEIAYILPGHGAMHGQSMPEGTEQLHAKRTTWNEVWAMLQRGEITDSITVVALLYEAVRRLQGADRS